MLQSQTNKNIEFRIEQYSTQLLDWDRMDDLKSALFLVNLADDCYLYCALPLTDRESILNHGSRNNSSQAPSSGTFALRFDELDASSSSEMGIDSYFKGYDGELGVAMLVIYKREILEQIDEPSVSDELTGGVYWYEPISGKTMKDAIHAVVYVQKVEEWEFGGITIKPSGQ